MNYENFLPSNHEEVKSAKTKLEEARSKLKKLERQQEEAEKVLPELKRDLVDAKIDGNGEEDAEIDYKKGQAQADKLTDSIDIQNKVVSRLQAKYEDIFENVTAELKKKAKKVRDDKLEEW